MKTVLFVLTFFAMTAMTSAQNKKTFYDFKATTIDGQPFDLSTLKGKKVLVVNVASKCGYTPQYAQLEELFKKYIDKNFVIIGFPANDFKEQEKGTDEEIAEFCKVNYAVSFLLMKKSSVIKDKEQNEVFKWLTNTAQNGWKG